MDLKSGRLIGAEALVRWRHPGHGPIPPADFIPLAEDTGLIIPTGEWVCARPVREGVLLAPHWLPRVARGDHPLRPAVPEP